MVETRVDLATELDDLLAEGVIAAREREATTFDVAAGNRAGNVVLFGAGGLGRQTLAGLRADGIEPLAFADNNAHRWGTEVDGVMVMSPLEASARFGDCAAFVVTIWGAGSTHRLEHSVEQLNAMGCDTVVPVAWLAWRHAARMLPHYAMHLPSRVLTQVDGIRRAFALLADDESRAEFVSQLRWRLTGDPGCLRSPVPGPQYLVTDTAMPIEGEVVLDVGAYDGDTLAAWLAARGATFSRYIALEPDPGSRAALEASVAGLPASVAERVVVLPFAAAAQFGTATFDAMGTAASSLGTSGTGVRVTCARIDDIIGDLGGPAPTFVKMDVEGAELGALAGAARLIADHAPVLALSAYHRQDHLWRVLLTVAALRPDYRFSLRPHNEEGWDLVLYAVPPARVPTAP